MRQRYSDIDSLDGRQGARRVRSDERIISYVDFLFLIVLITVVSMLQSGRIRFLEQRIQVLESGSATAASEMIGKEDKSRRDNSGIPLY
jgi:hypothetical protein